MLLDVYGSDHYPSATPYSFSGLDVESDGTNNFEVCFYGSEVFAGAVYGSPENKHSYFTLTVTCDDPIFIGIFGKNTITLKTLMESIGHAWGYDENPEYLFEVISADSSIIQGRQYTISDDGTIHVQIETTLLSIYHVQAQLNAKAIGVSGAVFKN